MNHIKTSLPGLEVTLTAHKDNHLCLLLAGLTAAEPINGPFRTPLQVCLVIDRSSSMSGEKLAITTSAVARFIRSLESDDRVAIVAYDDQVDLISGLQAPTEALARRVEALQSRGSTDLYGGWVTGAKVVGRGGRVILLSDGQANQGKFKDAISLSRHAALSYERYGVTTTTIGVGTDYDEGIMAGMARAGGGAHYFACTAPSIMEAFSQERYSAGSVVLERLTMRCNRTTEQLGHFWAGESKKRVFQVADLGNLQMSVRYTNKATGERSTHILKVPAEFGHSEEAKLEYLLQRASDVEGEMLQVRDPKSAGEMKERLRAIVLELLAHPTSDEPAVGSVVSRLKASIERLENLALNYVEEDAMIHRKRSMQSSHNMRERAQGYSSFEDDRDSVQKLALMSAPMVAATTVLAVDPEALKLAPIEDWIRWEAIPLQVLDRSIQVALEDPRRGFVVTEIERRTHRQVKPVFAGVPSTEILRILKKS